MDDDILNQETERTLTVLASSELLKPLVRRYPHVPWEMRPARFKDPRSEQDLLAMLAHEPGPDLRIDLAIGRCDLLTVRWWDRRTGACRAAPASRHRRLTVEEALRARSSKMASIRMAGGAEPPIFGVDGELHLLGVSNGLGSLRQ